MSIIHLLWLHTCACRGRQHEISPETLRTSERTLSPSCCCCCCFSCCLLLLLMRNCLRVRAWQRDTRNAKVWGSTWFGVSQRSRVSWKLCAKRNICKLKLVNSDCEASLLRWLVLYFIVFYFSFFLFSFIFACILRQAEQLVTAAPVVAANKI